MNDFTNVVTYGVSNSFEFSGSVISRKLWDSNDSYFSDETIAIKESSVMLTQTAPANQKSTDDSTNQEPLCNNPLKEAALKELCKVTGYTLKQVKILLSFIPRLNPI